MVKAEEAQNYGGENKGMRKKKHIHLYKWMK